ncbi:MAG: DUF2079 domain-containing protein [Actinomycetota bacterium]
MVWAAVAVYATVFSWLSVARHDAFSSGRFDLGNMVQAVWSTAHGRFLESTDVSGTQFTRLGAHVDPVLALFAPIFRLWPEPDVLLVTQAVAVALGALPAFWLGRLWLRDDRLAVAAAAAYLLYPPLQFATLFDFHPVTLAAPLLLYCIWAAETARWGVLAVCATLAALTQEQVGLLLATLAIWLAVRHPARRRAAAILAAGGLAWTVVATAVLIPSFAIRSANPHLQRYRGLGDSYGDLVVTLLTRPWRVLDVIATPGRLGYLLLLLAPLLFLPLAAPLLTACAVPQLAMNLLASTGPAQQIEYHYAAVLVPFLIAASIMGLARLRERRDTSLLARLTARPGRVAAALVAVLLLVGVRAGPLPIWEKIPVVGWSGAPHMRFAKDARAQAAERAVALVPPGAAVAASNDIGAHLSARRRVLLFPTLTPDVNWVIVSGTDEVRRASRDRPTLRPVAFGGRLASIRTRTAYWRPVFAQDGVEVYRRIRPTGIARAPLRDGA